MKLQVQGQGVRLRVDEAEFARLLAGETLVNRIMLGATIEFAQSLVLVAGASPTFAVVDGNWHVALPRDAVEAYARQLPCRHALDVELEPDGGVLLMLDFEVDVRDSMKTRGPRRRLQAPD
jgi:hypothetical protein